MPKSPLPAAPGWVALSRLNLQANLSDIPSSARGGYHRGWQPMQRVGHRHHVRCCRQDAAG
eukprot:13290055-Ditylum_brightwellii.AAC.1